MILDLLRGMAGHRVWVLGSVALAANLIELAGVYWDLGWHHAWLRDTFWSPPHLAIYSGVAIALLAAAAGLTGARKKRAGTAGLASTTGYQVALLGPTIQVVAAPIDELWHRVIGPDVSVWSPPHLLGILGGMIGVLGWILTLAHPHGAGQSNRDSRSLAFAFAVLLLGGTLIALGEYDHDPAVREPWLYPILTSFLAPWILVIARGRLRWPHAGTLVAVAYMVLRLALAAGVSGMGLPWLGVPPLIVAGAALLDLLADRRGPGTAGTAFGLAFTLSDYPLTYLVSGRAWTVLDWVGTLPAAAAAGYASALLGQYLSTSEFPGTKRER